MKKLGIIVAMDVEARLIIENLNLNSIDNDNKIYIKENIYGKYSSIVLIISGIGMENSAISTQTLALVYNVDTILNFGYVGSNVLKIGTVVSPNLVFNYDFDLTTMGYEKYKIPGTEDLVLNSVSEHYTCKCYSSNHFVTESNEESPTIYDMELHGIAMACSKNNISLSSIKIVTDSLNVDMYNKNEEDINFTKVLSDAVINHLK